MMPRKNTYLKTAVSLQKMSGKNSGQTIIEAMIAISITLIGLLGVLTLVSSSLAFTNDMSQKFIASYLSAEGIEIVKNLIDANIANSITWNSGLDVGSYETSAANPTLHAISGSGAFLRLLPSGEYSYDLNNGALTSYKRRVDIIASDANIITVDSTVSWVAHGKNQSVTVRDAFRKWR